MQLHVPDPAYTRSERARASFRLALKIATIFVMVLWLIHLANVALGLELQRFGVRPRESGGLPGILFAPLLHGSFAHLVSNSVPLWVLGAGMLHLYPAAAARVLPAIYLGPGIAVWLFGRASIHIGASGLVYGLLSYIFVAGLIRRDRRAIAATLLVCFLYGSLVWGVFPLQRGVSWETHLAAAIIGVLLAVALRGRDVPPRRKYDWEDEEAQREEAQRPDRDEDG